MYESEPIRRADLDGRRRTPEGIRAVFAVVLIVGAGLLPACGSSLFLHDADPFAPGAGDSGSAGDTISPGDSDSPGDAIASGDADAADSGSTGDAIFPGDAIFSSDTDPGDSDSMSDANPPGDFPPATGPCASQIEALADAMAEAGGGCAAVVRFSLFERELLGFQLLCGPYQTIDEEQARDLARSDGECGYGGAEIISPSDPDDAYVFYVPALDAGCGAAVSSETGLTLFGGTFIWQGYGDITYPTSWRDPGELGSACAAQAVPASTRGYNLVVGEDLAEDKVDAALVDIADTALPDALALRGELRSAIILEYPRKLGLYEGQTAEWIVILSGGHVR